jgi:multidrug efflux pump
VRQLVAVQHRQERTGAARGPRRDHHAGARADGATLDFTARYLDAIDRITSQYPEFDRRFLFMGGGQVSRARSCCGPSTGPSAPAPRWNSRVPAAQGGGLPGISAFPITPPSLGQGFRERPINFVIVSSDSYDNMARVAAADDGRDGQEPRHRAARHRPAAEQARDLHGRRPHRAADMGVSVDAVARTVETMLGGRVVTRYKRDADQYDVIVQTSAAAAPRPTTSRSSSCAAATTPWCRCRRWSRCARR